jgi:(5-formylfuran-3-yl)methyl phosphate synthase
MSHSAYAAAPKFLASVTSAPEARLALSCGAGIIDAKNPAAGALGALPVATVADIVRAVGGAIPVSATIGDLPADPGRMAAAAVAMAGTGVDIVKAGFFGDRDPRPAIAHLGGQDLGSARLVAVLMADRPLDLTVIPALAAAGFAGVMLDTADKARGRLTTLLDGSQLAEFLRITKAYHMMTGLAGSLRGEDIASLRPLRPDVLGFRGALCSGGRNGCLDAERINAISLALGLASTSDVSRQSVA